MPQALTVDTGWDRYGSLPTFAAFARQKKLVNALSVRFLRAALSISHLQRMAGIRPKYRMLRLSLTSASAPNRPFAAVALEVLKALSF